MTPLRKVRDIAIAILLLALPFFVLNASLKNPESQNWLDRQLLAIFGVAQVWASWAAHVVSDALHDYVYLAEVKEENERLRARLARLETERKRLVEEGIQNRRLRALLQLRERLGGDIIAADVIAKDITSPHFRVARIAVDRGSRDRVRPGMPVISERGLVGMILRTSHRFADVQLIVDRRSAVDVIVQRTGARGMLRGTGENHRYMARIQYMSREDTIEIGDLVHTSGLGQRFPPSILVGQITKIVRADYGLYQEVEVTPSVDFSRLQTVLILAEGALGDVLVEQERKTP
ncbi:MAG: rod shape-determining protein MreC [Deltaproteobacteria bacterium]|nr:rod shape-determining protein MreC [Sandaracinaceae bacterium]MCX7808669.1 rod shape-determining protein MreC [Deltaproteobacteria bacterium]MDW8245559.1 rod shape-determining protein MreC [Sandaracinaceae bacterium]